MALEELFDIIISTVKTWDNTLKIGEYLTLLLFVVDDKSTRTNTGKSRDFLAENSVLEFAYG